MAVQKCNKNQNINFCIYFCIATNISKYIACLKVFLGMQDKCYYLLAVC